RQAGVNHAVGRLPYEDSGVEKPWEFMPMMRMKQRFDDAGYHLAAIESSPPMEKIRLGLPGRDEEIDWFNTLLRNMGALGIPVICYNFMAVIGWTRTSTTAPGRGG